MSKFTRIINTFKNGLVSPRLRGAVVDQAGASSCEVLDNFIIDKTGSATKRPGLYLETKETINGTENFQHFNFKMLGTNYIFKFNSNLNWNSVDSNFNSTYLKLYSENTANIVPVNTFSKGLQPLIIQSWSYSGYTITINLLVGHGIIVGDTVAISGLVSTRGAPNGPSCVVTATTSTSITYLSNTEAISVPINLSAWGAFTPPSTAFVTNADLPGNQVITGDILFLSGLTSGGGTPPVGPQIVSSSGPGTSIFIPPSTATAPFNLPSGYKASFVTPPTGTPTLSSGIVTVSKTAHNPMWNGRISTAGNFISSGLEEYLSVPLTIYTAKKISERSIVFSTSNFSFLFSILEYSSELLIETEFIIYPYFVSEFLLKNTLGKSTVSAAPCPITPSNFPFDPTNTDTSLVITSAVVLDSGGNSQGGSLPTSGILSKSSERFVWLITIPKKILTSSSSEFYAEGRFLSIPSNDGTKDVVFFITKEYQILSSTKTYFAIQCVGGVTAPSTTLWKFSSWGEQSHPQTVGFAFSRLMYANTSKSPSGWWSSAIHPDNRFYRQGFLQYPLLQDATSNFSGINYQGKSGGGSTDIFRFGFSDSVPNFGTINWISSRRAIHFGTDLGECQANISNGVYDAASYSQNIVGTYSCSKAQSADGDMKIFHITNSGKDIRTISTQDKDYDSIDNLLTISLEGLNIRFKKIEWVDDLNILLCLTNDLRIFSLAMYKDTGIKAFSEIKTTKNIVDFAGSRIFLKDDTSVYNLNLLKDIPYLTDSFLPSIHADIYSFGLGSYPSFTPYEGKKVIIYINKIKYSFDVPVGSFLSSLLPISPSELDAEDVVYVYEDAFSSKLRTMPIHEGARFGSSVGDVQRVDRITVLVDNSGSFYYGPDELNLLLAENMGTSDTKLVTIDFPQSPDREQFIYIESSEPTPLNISGISLRGVSYSGE